MTIKATRKTETGFGEDQEMLGLKCLSSGNLYKP